MRDRLSQPLSSGAPPPWAEGWGEDEYGPWASFRVGEVDHRLRWIRPGWAELGTPPGADGRRVGTDWQQTVWKVESGFWLGEVPCTRELWAEVMFQRRAESHLPVVNVSALEVDEFFATLRARDPRLAFELPSEARWEYACRAGRASPTWVGEERPKTKGPRPVASPNPWGLRDLLGNVLEWCQDADLALERPRPDGAVPRDGPTRVARGGRWSGQVSKLRAATRSAYPVAKRDDFLGFRLCRSGGR